MSDHNSKFYSRSLTLLLPILKMINDNFSLTKIAQVLNIKKSHLTYYLKKAKLIGYVNEVFRDRIKILELTQSGKNFLAMYENYLSHGTPICRSENIRFKAEIIKMPSSVVDWRKIEMNNWGNYVSQSADIKVHINYDRVYTRAN